MSTCMLCDEEKGGEYLIVKNKGGICFNCVRDISFILDYFKRLGDIDTANSAMVKRKII